MPEALPTASGCVSVAENALRNMLSNCTEFISWCGESTAAAALDHIYVHAVDPPTLERDAYTLAELRELRPYVIIWTDDEGFSWEEEAVNHFGARGKLTMRFDQDVPDAYVSNYAGAERAFTNSLGAIMRSGDSSNPGLVELSRTAGYLHLTGIHLRYTFRARENEAAAIGDIQMAVMTVDWMG